MELAAGCRVDRLVCGAGGPVGDVRGVDAVAAVKDIPHGRKRYSQGCRCATCRAGHRHRQNETRYLRAERLQQDPTAAPHGRLNTYLNWMCRCQECCAAMAAQDRKRKDRQPRTTPFGREWIE